MASEDCTFFQFSHQMAEETGSKQVVVGTLARHFQMVEDDFALNQLLLHRLIMGIPMLIHQVLELIRSC